MRRSVLIAGMNDEENQYMRFAADAWLDWEHMCETEKAEQVEPVEPEPIKASHDEHDHSATTDLLLEAISKSQDEVRALREMIEKTVPEIIQREMRGVTVLLGSLVPKLQGLSPEQVIKVDQMLDLFLSMRS